VVIDAEFEIDRDKSAALFNTYPPSFPPYIACKVLHFVDIFSTLPGSGFGDKGRKGWPGLSTDAQMQSLDQAIMPFMERRE
jgi:hypothetical protein